jgi:hypothetical protein
MLLNHYYYFYYYYYYVRRKIIPNSKRRRCTGSKQEKSERMVANTKHLSTSSINHPENTTKLRELSWMD